MSLKDVAEYRLMAAMIKDRIAGRRVAFFTMPGNLGDALIEAGAQAFLRSHDIPFSIQNSRRLRDLRTRYYKLAYAKNLSLRIMSAGLYQRYRVSLRQVSQDHDVAIICGSGSFASHQPVGAQIQDVCADWFSDVIVLPSTYSIAPRSARNSLFFARDRFDSLNVIPDATFCHDLAFYLAPDVVTPCRRVGYHLRTDNESSGQLPAIPENVDVSACGTELDPESLLFAEVGKSEIVITDRLHVCIAAALLGRRVYLFCGSYFKIEAIFKSSIEPYYPNVSLLDEWSQLPVELRSEPVN